MDSSPKNENSLSISSPTCHGGFHKKPLEFQRLTELQPYQEVSAGHFFKSVEYQKFKMPPFIFRGFIQVSALTLKLGLKLCHVRPEVLG